MCEYAYTLCVQTRREEGLIVNFRPQAATTWLVSPFTDGSGCLQQATRWSCPIVLSDLRQWCSVGYLLLLSFSSPHFHVFSYASCIDLTQLLSQPSATWRTLRVPL